MKAPVYILMLGTLAMLTSCAQTGTKPAKDSHRGDTAVLWSYAGSHRMTPPPTLHSDLSRVRIQRVELLTNSTGGVMTKITYSPCYGKISSGAFSFWTTNETQAISILLHGNHSSKVKEGDILRTCFYPN